MENTAHVPEKRSGRYCEGGHPRVYNKVDRTKQLALQSEASWNLSSLLLSKDGDLKMQGSIKNWLGTDIIYWGDDRGFYQKGLWSSGV